LPKEAAVKVNVKAGAFVAAISALTVAVPASAHPGHSVHHNNSNPRSGVNQHSGSHRCTPHDVAYIESGTVDSAITSTLAANPDGSWSGTLVVDVSSADHWAKADKGTTVTFTFTNAHLIVRFDGSVTGLAAGERVKLLGKLAVVPHNCTVPTPVPAPGIRVAVIQPANS
jgi:hypothetical protein